MFHMSHYSHDFLQNLEDQKREYIGCILQLVLQHTDDDNIHFIEICYR